MKKIKNDSMGWKLKDKLGGWVGWVGMFGLGKSESVRNEGKGGGKGRGEEGRCRIFFAASTRKRQEVVPEVMVVC